MIANLTGLNGVTVTGTRSGMPFVSPNPNNPMHGMVRLNNSNFEVFTGSHWEPVGASYATVELDNDTRAIVEWARHKRQEEWRLDEMCKKYPGLAKSRDSFETFKRLVEDDYKNSI